MSKRIIARLTALVLACTGALAAADFPALLVDCAGGVGDAAPSAFVTQQRAVALDVALLRKGQELVIPTFDGIEIPVRIDAVVRRGRSTIYRASTIDEASGYVSIVRTGAACVLTVSSVEHGVYEAGGPVEAMTLRAFDGNAMPQCGGVHADQAPASQRAGGVPTYSSTPDQVVADPTTVDVLFSFSQPALADAKSSYGGTDDEAMEAFAQAAIDSANTTYSNSGITLTLNLVHVHALSEDESGGFDWQTVLGRYRGNADGYYDEVHTLRDTYAADMCSMIVADSTYCGLASLIGNHSSPNAEQYAFSMVSNNCAIGYFSFAHELGHNFGCHHDRDNAVTTPAFDYSYGYRWTSSGTQYRSVMAYSPGSRVSYFSNPDITHMGQATGVAAGQSDSANNALTINNTSPYVADFRVPSGNQVPSASGDSYTTAYETTLTVSAPGVLDNDSDPDGDALTAILDSDVGDGSLTLNSDGSFEYVPASSFNGDVTFTYHANDGSADSSTVTVTITVNAENDNPPTDIALSNDSIADDSPSGTVVGVLSATDADVGDSHTFDLVSGTGDTDNADFTISGDQLETAAPLDYEQQTNYSVRVQVTDGTGNTYAEALTIVLSDTDYSAEITGFDVELSVGDGASHSVSADTGTVSDVGGGAYEITGVDHAAVSGSSVGVSIEELASGTVVERSVSVDETAAAPDAQQ